MNKKYLKISAIYYLAALLVCVFFVLGYLNVVKSNVLSSVLIQVISMLVIPFLLYTLLEAKTAKQTYLDCGIKKINSKTLVITIILGFLLYFLNSFVADFSASILNFFKWENIYGQFTKPKIIKFTPLLLVQEVILSCLFPAVCEEFLHRGLLLHAGKKHVNTKFCLIISSLFFGLMHLNIQQFFYAAVLGYLMGLITLAANSIIPSVIIHFMNNALSTYFYYGRILGWKFPMLYNKFLSILYNNPAIYIMVTLVSVLSIIYFVFYLIIKLKKIYAKKQVKELVKNLNIESLPVEEVSAKIDQANLILNQTYSNSKLKKPSLKNSLFTISTFVLTGVITICTFIWGLI